MARGRANCNGFHDRENTQSVRNSFPASPQIALDYCLILLSTSRNSCSLRHFMLSLVSLWASLLLLFSNHPSPLCSLLPCSQYPTPFERASQFPPRLCSLSHTSVAYLRSEVDFSHLCITPHSAPIDPAQYRACNSFPINNVYIEFKDDGSLTFFAANFNSPQRFLLNNRKIRFQWSNAEFECSKPSIVVL